MERIRFRCDACGKILKAWPDIIGCKCKCTRCGRITTVPSVSTVIRRDRDRGKKGISAPAPAPVEEDEGEEFEGVIEAEEITTPLDGTPAAEGNQTRRREGRADDQAAWSTPTERVQQERDNSAGVEGRQAHGRDSYDDNGDEGRPDQTRRSGRPVDWYMVRSGLYYVYLGSCAWLAATTVTLGGAVLAPVLWLLSILFVLVPITAALLTIASFVLNFIGSFYCLSAPRKHWARTLALINVCLYGVTAVLWLVETLAGLGGFRLGPLGFGSLHLVLNGATFIVWLLFLGALTLALKAPELLLAVRNLLIGYVCAGAVLFVLACVALCVSGLAVVGAFGSVRSLAGAGVTAAVLYVVAAVIAFGVYCWYLNTLVEILAAIDDRHCGGASREMLWARLAITIALLFPVQVIEVFVVLERQARKSAPSAVPGTNLPPGFSIPFPRDNGPPADQPTGPPDQPAPATPKPLKPAVPAPPRNPAGPDPADSGQPPPTSR